MHDVLHHGLFGTDIELVLHKAFDHGRRVLRIDRARGSHRARQKFGGIAGAGFHIQHLHAGLDLGEGEQFCRLAARVGLAVGLGAIGGGDDGGIVRRVAVLRRGLRGEECQQSECTCDVRASNQNHENYLFFSARNIASRRPGITNPKLPPTPL
jgi:hypothetical protein